MKQTFAAFNFANRMRYLSAHTLTVIGNSICIHNHHVVELFIWCLKLITLTAQNNYLFQNFNASLYMYMTQNMVLQLFKMNAIICDVKVQNVSITNYRI